MPALEWAQETVMRAIALGPDHMPEGLFTGMRSNAVRGLSVHANTISHARLIALEETFPRTRRYLGEAEFNRLSRAFCESGHAGSQPLARIGCRFPAWLDHAGQSGTAGSLARFEWTWLECYHACEATAFGMDELASLSEAEIAMLALARHPASAVVTLDADGRELLVEEFAGEFDSTEVLISRPEAEIEVTSISATAARLHATFVKPQPVCTVLAEAAEPDAEAALLGLIAAGALVQSVEGRTPC
ncbi:MAG: putative DNA-binding domain-containing protein [Novosphingobium sp.]